MKRIIAGLLLFACVGPAAYGKRHGKKAKGVAKAMTVAAIRPAIAGETFVRVTFYQSQRFYKLQNDANPAFMELLRQSGKDNKPVLITRASEESDVILDVKAAP